MALSLAVKRVCDLVAMLAPPMEWRSWWAWRMELHLDRQHQFLPCQSCKHDILYWAWYLSETKNSNWVRYCHSYSSPHHEYALYTALPLAHSPNSPIFLCSICTLISSCSSESHDLQNYTLGICTVLVHRYKSDTYIQYSHHRVHRFHHHWHP